MTKKIARLSGQPGAIKHRGRTFTVFDEKYGWLTKKWPKARGKPVSDAQASTQTQFQQSTQLIKLQAPEFVAGATSDVAGTGWYPRDVLMSASYGKYITGVTKDGTVWRGYILVATEIQTSLDSITLLPGSLLYRNQNQWVGLNAGQARQILAIDQVTGFPSWQAPPGGGNTGGATINFSVPSTTLVSGTALNTGIELRAETDLWIFGLGATIKDNHALTLAFGIAPWSPSTSKITAAPSYVTSMTTVNDGRTKTAGGLLQTPFKMSAGQDYLIFATTQVPGLPIADVMCGQALGSLPPYFSFPASPRTYLFSADPLPTTSSSWTEGSGIAAWQWQYTQQEPAA